MAENKIPKRSEVPEELTWNLGDMFESDEAWYKENEALKEMPGRIAAFQGKLGEKLATYADQARQCRELATIRRDAPVTFWRMRWSCACLPCTATPAAKTIRTRATACIRTCAARP